MPSFLKYLGQAVFFAGAAALTGYLSVSPPYQQIADNVALIKLSFAHGAQRVEDCRRLTPQEIAALPPLERRPNTCSRERIPVYMEFSIDGNLVYAQTLTASGLSNDGPARTYRKYHVPAGDHVLTARLRDTKRATGFDYEMQRTVTLAAGQSIAVDFRTEANGFIIR